MAESTVLYLASRSPRRVELLAQLGLHPKVIAGDVDESPLPGEVGLNYVERMARGKAQAGLQGLFDVQSETESAKTAIVLGADTALLLDGNIIGKPRDTADAVAILQRLSGRTHQVVSSVALASASDCAVATSVSLVTFMTLREAQIETYIASGEGVDKAGSYAIQGSAAKFITGLAGSYSGVMGLPLYETSQLLERFGVVH